ncbi:MAG: T9SS type A sorting domain-containing protein [Bacteroidetes bacterium]|nr:T9SS type A sorting domain-containing protein [Fibrella sp.]
MSPDALSLLPPDYDCNGGGLTVQVSGGTRFPIEYRVAGLRNWSSRADFIIPAWQRIGTTFTIEARQSGQVISRSFTSSCGSARLASLETESSLDIVLYPNPVGEQFTVGVTGAAGKTVQFTITSLDGRCLVRQRRLVDVDQHTESMTMPVDAAAGIYLLEVNTGERTKTLKLLKQ